MSSRVRRLIRRIEHSLKRAARRSPRLVEAYRSLKKRRHERRLGNVGAHTNGDSGVNPENLVWIFGTGRSGSTWLRSMMGEVEGHRVWEEPMVGRLFGDFYERAQDGNLRSVDFIMGDPIRKGWISSIRSFILDGARYSHPELQPGEYLVVKEPSGSVGAPIIMEALPESRMILLVRDPRDVVASALDGAREGNWLHEWRGSSNRTLADERPDAFVKRQANTYRRNLRGARKAYEAHAGHKALIRYEDLRADAVATLKSAYAELEIPFEEEALVRAVEKHSWENIPEREKGEGKFYRKASPGSWREDLSPRQVRTVEEITSPIIGELYPAG